MMKKLGLYVAIAAGMLLLTTAAFAQKEDLQGQGRAVVTVLPAHSGQQPTPVSLENVQIKVNGKQANVTGWTPFVGSNARTEIVLLIDDSARNSLSLQLGEITDFVKHIPQNTKITIAYMENGRAVLTTPLSANPAVALSGLHVTSSIPGENGSPYFCLSELAKHWPSQDGSARRVVVMITDGVDEYEMRYDPEDPHVQAAIDDSARAGLAVYSIYWHDQGFVDRTRYGTAMGQNLLAQLTQATGGVSYWIGSGNPVSFQPYFADIMSRLSNQYALTFSAPLARKPGVQTLQIKVNIPATKVDAPKQVYVDHTIEAMV
jgi:hypothetical protein